MTKAFIAGLAGTQLTADEAQFLAAQQPCGIILFARNCRDHGQIRKLVADARSAIAQPHTLVLIDQEGGRVQRLRPPLGRALPPATRYGEWYGTAPAAAMAATRRIAHLLAADLRELGIDTDCAPVADVPVPGAHDIIGDRAFARDPDTIARLAGAFAAGLTAGGVLPVIKHIPGHGRATADSHLELPVVPTAHAELSRTDFMPFRVLAAVPAAMSAHVVYTAIDAARPASVSRVVHDRVIRGEIGYDGLLMSDDISMRALSGNLAERATAVIAAGSDVALHCNGQLDEMRAVAAAVPRLAGRALERFGRCRTLVDAGTPPSASERGLAEDELHALLEPQAPPPESV